MECSVRRNDRHFIARTLAQDPGIAGKSVPSHFW